jgi:hypothetical protein
MVEMTRSMPDSRDIVESMRREGWVGPPALVVRMPDGGMTTLDNARLAAAVDAGIEIVAEVHEYHEALPPAQHLRFADRWHGTPQTWGEAVTNRIASQGASWAAQHPQGDPRDGRR